jgi:hypothetical protein
MFIVVAGALLLQDQRRTAVARLGRGDVIDAWPNGKRRWTAVSADENTGSSRARWSRAC